VAVVDFLYGALATALSRRQAAALATRRLVVRPAEGSTVNYSIHENHILVKVCPDLAPG
jgi:hypothetical protein